MTPSGPTDVEALVETVRQFLQPMGHTGGCDVWDEGYCDCGGNGDEGHAALASLAAVVTEQREALEHAESTLDYIADAAPNPPNSGYLSSWTAWCKYLGDRARVGRDGARAALAASAGGEDG